MQLQKQVNLILHSIVIGGTEYTITTGSLHTKDRPINLKSNLEDSGFIYKHYDICYTCVVTLWIAGTSWS